jgi:hypothetical protein
MGFSRIPPPQRRQPASETPAPIETVEEATRLLSVAVQKMVAAIAGHDFVTARNYSYEEWRLRQLLETSGTQRPRVSYRDTALVAGHSSTIARLATCGSPRRRSRSRKERPPSSGSPRRSRAI